MRISGMSGVVDAARRHRWAFEPALGLVILTLWAISALVFGGTVEFGGVLLLCAAIGLSRILPGTALGLGVLSLVVLVGAAVPDFAGAWVLFLAGMIVFFGAAAYGTTLARWVGFVGALSVSFLIGGEILLSAFTVGDFGIPFEVFSFGTTTAVLGLHVIAAQLVAAAQLGAWAAGLGMRGRADAPSHPSAPARSRRRAAIEDWLLLPVPDRAMMHELRGWSSRWLRPVTVTEFSIDVVAAILFCLLAFASFGSEPGAEAVVVIGFSVTLVLRRISPAAALSLAWLTAIVQMACGLSVVSADIAILAVLYATAAYGGRVLRYVGLVSVGVGSLVASLYLAGVANGGLIPTSADLTLDLVGYTLTQIVLMFIGSAAVLGLSWTLGLLVRTWQNARNSRQQQIHAVEEQRAAERTVVVEQERNRIARDMHDVVAHSLAVVIAQADGARYARATDPGAVDSALTSISSTARGALAEVRILLTQLRQEEAAGPQPVLADLERLVQQMRGTGLTVAWTTTGTEFPIGTGAQLAIYRIIQEALTNALRHGDPEGRVQLCVAWQPAALVVTVENPLRPDAVNAVPGAGVGHGLPGMRERAILAGGSLFTEAADGCFRVTATLPAGLSAPTAPIVTPVATDRAMPVSPLIEDVKA